MGIQTLNTPFSCSLSTGGADWLADPIIGHSDHDRQLRTANDSPIFQKMSTSRPFLTRTVGSAHFLEDSLTAVLYVIGHVDLKTHDMMMRHRRYCKRFIFWIISGIRTICCHFQGNTSNSITFAIQVTWVNNPCATLYIFKKKMFEILEPRRVILIYHEVIFKHIYFFYLCLTLADIFSPLIPNAKRW